MLVKSQGWDRQVKIAQAQVQARTAKVMGQRVAEIGAALEQEFEKGEASGISLFLAMPYNEIAMLKETIEQIEGEEKKDGE
jgi:hypothetical protein